MTTVTVASTVTMSELTSHTPRGAGHHHRAEHEAEEDVAATELEVGEAPRHERRRDDDGDGGEHGDDERVDQPHAEGCRAPSSSRARGRRGRCGHGTRSRRSPTP